VEQAIPLLTDTRQKLCGIARVCGFSGAEHFTRVFRRAKGMPPSQYRKNNPQ
jgi:transcriptional regulator GlxA family with amidase domain